MTKLKFNVAQLLRQEVGARRDRAFTEHALPLDNTLVLRDISGHVRFTRSASGVFVHIQAGGTIRLTCVRSLEEFDYPIELNITDEFHAVIDVLNGYALSKPTEEDPFLLDEFHMADIGEAIREYTLLQVPLNPVCEAYRNQPVSYSTMSEGYNEDTSEASVYDKRLEILKTWTRNNTSE